MARRAQEDQELRRKEEEEHAKSCVFTALTASNNGTAGYESDSSFVVRRKDERRGMHPNPNCINTHTENKQSYFLYSILPFFFYSFILSSVLSFFSSVLSFFSSVLSFFLSSTLSTFFHLFFLPFLEPVSRSTYMAIQRGDTDIPFSGLQKPAPLPRARRG